MLGHRTCILQAASAVLGVSGEGLDRCLHSYSTTTAWGARSPLLGQKGTHDLPYLSHVLILKAIGCARSARSVVTMA